MKLPKGYPAGKSDVKIAVKLSRPVFEKLVARAAKDKVSFSVTVEDVLKCGILDLEESEALEPQ
jgi:hypothetical protein